MREYIHITLYELAGVLCCISKRGYFTKLHYTYNYRLDKFEYNKIPVIGSQRSTAYPLDFMWCFDDE